MAAVSIGCIMELTPDLMKNLTTILAWLNHSAQPPETQSPIRTATAATFLSLLFVVGLDHYFAGTLPSWWAELLAYAAIPILLAFIVLYRSAWHEGLRRGARALLVAATSCAIFSAVALGTLLAAVLAALTYASNFDRFLAFHY